MAFRPPSFSDGLQGAPHKALGEPLAVPGCARSRHAWGREGERSPVVRAPHGRGGRSIVGGPFTPGVQSVPGLAERPEMGVSAGAEPLKLAPLGHPSVSGFLHRGGNPDSFEVVEGIACPRHPSGTYRTEARWTRLCAPTAPMHYESVK